MSHKHVRTKFIASLGPACSSDEVIRTLMEAGVSMFRCNFSHMAHQEYRDRRNTILRLNSELGTHVLIQADLQGPHIRLDDLGSEGYFVKEHQSYVFVTNGPELQDGEVRINDDILHECIKVGEPIAFLNGVIEGEVTKVDGQRITVRMINSGTLKSHKSINLPETQLKSCLTDKDREDLNFLLEEGVDWLALSFVSNAGEVEEVRRLVGDRPVKLMSKIERSSAVENLIDIIQASDAAMVARGDLGVEVPMEEVPIIQKEIIELCHFNHKPAVVATQMLLSMTHSLRPTRAEVSDVANAVFERADAVMLSEETTEGIDPVNALSTMVTIAARAEKYLYKEPNYFDREN